MKRKLLSVVAIGALLAGGLSLLASCNSNNNQGGGQDSSQKSDAKYKVEYSQSADFEIGGLKESYQEGETVTFTVTVKNSGKKIKNIRVTGNEFSKQFSASDNNQYSFEMPGEDVQLKVNLSDVQVPVLAATYSGLPLVGKTLTISTTIDAVANSEFTVTAKAGASLVEINGHQVTLKAAGNVTLEIAASKDGTALKVELSFEIHEDESALGTNIAYDDFLPIEGGEGATTTNLGKIVYNRNDGGTFDPLSYDKASNLYTWNYTNGWTWHSVQLFYRLPYAEVGDTYKLAWEVESDVAGQITISGQVVNINAGKNYVLVDLTQGGSALVSIQLGVNSGGNGTVFENGSVLKFSPFRLYDTNTSHVYHHVVFKNGNEVIKDIYVRDGKKVVAPFVDAGDNYLFQGFYDDATVFADSMTITKDYTFVARLVEKTAENTKHVTLKSGSKTLAVVDVFVGSSLVVPQNLDIGFGRKIVGYYTDPDCTQAYNISDPVQNDFDLYLKTNIVLEATYCHNFAFEGEWYSNNADGSLRIHFTGRGMEDSWNIQANFTDSVIIGEVGKTYTISFEYSMNVDGARYQIWDPVGQKSIGADNVKVGEHQTGQVTYEGGELSNGRYFTFEFGSVAAGAEVEFVLHDIQLTVA